MANLVVSAVSTWDNSGLKKGEKSLSAFDRSINRVAKSLALTFGATTLLRFSKNAVKAFMADEAAAKSLEVQLKNLGYGFATTNVENYIAQLEKSTGVLDDHLRPAFQTLLTTTGLVTESQKALQVALDTSAATGMSLESVSSALAAGYRGQTKALRTLGVNLSKTALTAGNMATALKEIGAAYSGQSLARLDTYAGKMDLLNGAASRATETIGKGLLDSLALLSKDNSIQGAADDMEYFAKKVADAAYGMASLLKKLDKFTGLDKVSTDTLFMLSNPLLALLANYGSSERPNTGRANRTYQGGQTSNDLYVLQKAEATAIKNANKLRAQENAALKAKAALQGLIDKYDVERIGLMAALNAATDEETKARLADKLAILDGNAAMAAKYLAERNAEQGLEELAAAADDAKKAFDRLAKWDPLSGLKATEADKAATTDLAALAALAASLGTLASGLTPKGGKSAIDTANSIINGQVNPNAFMPPATTPYDPLSSLMATMADISSAGAYNPLSGLRATSQEVMDIRLTIDGGSDKLSQAIAESIQVATRSGYSTTPAGFLS